MTRELGMKLRPAALALVSAVASALVFEGCSCGGAEETGGPGGAGSSSGGTGGAGGSAFPVGVGGAGGVGAGSVDCAEPCEAGEICSHGVCVPQAACDTDDECDLDTRCDPALGCVPWAGGEPPYDEACLNAIPPGIFSPAVKCEFKQAPEGDPFPGHVDVQATPIVVNFRKPASSGPPSIAAAFTATVPSSYTEDLGVVRVLRGDTCALEANLGGTDLDGDGTLDWIVSSASLAAGDLDGDGVAEIVAYGADGSTLAFTNKAGSWSLLWKAPWKEGIFGGPCDTASHRCGLGWAGPSIHDLDDDGKPEVLREAAVFGADGTLLSGAPPGYASYRAGAFSVVANLDGDPRPETTNGHLVWEWQPEAGWVKEDYFPGASPSAPGHVALADFGAFGADPDAPEIVVVRDSAVMVYATTGELAQPAVPVPGPGGGGPPTVSDFDGDGLPEVGVAGQAFYTVYDIDCGPSPRPGGVCPSGPCDYLGPGAACEAGSFIAWSRSTQDISSNVTGSSIFDFEADGKSEVVYADECFVRVYDGVTGDVVFSQYRSSCTWYENPIIADTDGNFRADLVTPSNKACSGDGSGIACTTLNADGVDPQFPGLRCESSADCVSGLCDAGLCRCVTSAECCAAGDDAACLEEGFKCAAPDPASPGSGNTCRAAHPHGLSGIRVYRDAADRWVRSRTIWNQHPYAVTHVEEDGTIPKTSAWKKNWKEPTLNNFRQNVPGTAGGAATGDLTSGASKSFTCTGGGAKLSAPVCNRGAEPVAPGVSVGFYADAEKACSAETTKTLAPGECETVSCVWASPPTEGAKPADVTVIPNDDGAYAECKAGNNEGTVEGVVCVSPK